MAVPRHPSIGGSPIASTPIGGALDGGAFGIIVCEVAVSGVGGSTVSRSGAIAAEVTVTGVGASVVSRSGSVDCDVVASGSSGATAHVTGEIAVEVAVLGDGGAIGTPHVVPKQTTGITRTGISLVRTDDASSDNALDLSDLTRFGIQLTRPQKVAA